MLTNNSKLTPSMKTGVNLKVFMLASLYIILPSYFAFEIGGLPSFTGSRVVLLLSLILLFVSSRRLTVIHSRLFIAVLVYAIGIIVVDFTHFSDAYSYSVNDILAIILENIILLVVVVNVVKTERALDSFINLMVGTSAILGVFAVIEFATGFNVFHILTTSTRDFLQSSYYRLGMRRSASGFGHSVYYAVYCMGMIPFCTFCYERSKNSKYIVYTAINLLGVVVSGARAQYVFTLILLFLMYRKETKEFRHKYNKYIFIGIALIIIAVAVIPLFRVYVIQNIISILSNLGFNFSVSDAFGVNANGLYSRTVQLSGIEWVKNQGKMWTGLGTASAYRGLVQYYYADTGWQTTSSIDIGYMSWFLNHGLVGVIVNLVMYVSIVLFLHNKNKHQDKKTLYNCFQWFFVGYIMNLFTTTGVGKMLWIVIGLLFSFERISRRQQSEQSFEV